MTQQLGWKFVTHHWTHFDEYVAMALLRMYGPTAGLKGIIAATVNFVDAGSDAPSYLVGRDWEQEHIVPFGVWKDWGPFDEHRGENQIRQHQESAASLVLGFLKKRIPDFNDPRADAISAYATQIDLMGGATKQSLPNIVKNMNWLGGQEQTLQWVLEGINVYLKHGDPSQTDFNLETIGALMSQKDGATTKWLLQGHEAIVWEQNTFQAAIESVKNEKQRLRLEHVGRKNDSTVKIAAFESDNPMMARAMLVFLKADVAIVKKPNGHVAILSSGKSRIDLTGLARMLNRAELELRKDQRVAEMKFGELSPDGAVPGSVWSFQRSAKNQSLLNGAPSAPSVHPTQIGFKRIFEIATLALDEKRFATQEADGYACNSCDSRNKQACPFFSYGLPRCQDIRVAKRNTKQGHQHPSGNRIIDPCMAKLKELQAAA